MRKAFALLIVGVSLGLAGPASAGPPPTDRPEVDPAITDGSAKRDFLDARAKWLESGIVGYRMKVSRYCYCASPFSATVTVRGRKPVKVSVENWTGPKTVPAMFRIIGQAIKEKVATLDTAYQSRQGYPKKASIDYIAMAVDDEVSYRITGFKTLQTVTRD